MGKKRITIYAVLLIIALVVVFLPGYSELQKVKERNVEQQKQILLLEKSNKELEEEVGKVERDPLYLEKKAREKLGIVKKGEIIYRKA
ncbi:MAG: septum formation initiator family protein [Candidatus Omnitrophota bacterium]